MTKKLIDPLTGQAPTNKAEETTKNAESRRYTDLAGEKFGRLTVLKGIEPRNGRRYWLCRCSCGREKEILGYSLRNGKTRSCGCLRIEMYHNRKLMDLTGHQYGKLTVLKEVDRRNNLRYWLCRCTCGKKKEIPQTSLRSGLSKSCGGCLLDLTGQTFGRLTVLKEAKQRNKHRYWLCQCTCGHKKEISQPNLRSKSTTSCGCLLKDIHRARRGAYLTGQQINHWTVLEEAPPRRTVRYWRCRCVCGTERDVAQRTLNNGKSKSCGCRGKRRQEI